MGIFRRATQPVGITNASGQPEIEMEIAGLKLSAAPPPVTPASDDRGEEDTKDPSA